MKMIETLSIQEKNKMLIQRQVVGIFSEMFKPEDPFYSLAYPICVGYYTTHSANKPVAPIYQIILDFIKEKGLKIELIALELNGEIIPKSEFENLILS